jgi:hypothetical protein
MLLRLAAGPSSGDDADRRRLNSRAGLCWIRVGWEGPPRSPPATPPARDAPNPCCSPLSQEIARSGLAIWCQWARFLPDRQGSCKTGTTGRHEQEACPTPHTDPALRIRCVPPPFGRACRIASMHALLCRLPLLSAARGRGRRRCCGGHPPTLRGPSLPRVDLGRQPHRRRLATARVRARTTVSTQSSNSTGGRECSRGAPVAAGALKTQRRCLPDSADTHPRSLSSFSVVLCFCALQFPMVPPATPFFGVSVAVG